MTPRRAVPRGAGQRVLLGDGGWVGWVHTDRVGWTVYDVVGGVDIYARSAGRSALRAYLSRSIPKHLRAMAGHAEVSGNKIGGSVSRIRRSFNF